MIVFNQKTQYNNLIANGFEKFPNFRDLSILAKEWFFVEKMDTTEIKTRLIAFCAEKSPNFKEEPVREIVDKVIKKLENTEKYTELPEKLVFYREEKEELLKITNKECRKLIFIFCCLSKLKKSDGIYLNSQSAIKLSDIFDLCKIKKSKIQQEPYLNKLYKEGLLSVDLKPLLKYHPTCLKNDGEVAFEFEPSENMINELLKLDEKNIKKCIRCGKEVLKGSNRTKYCKECYRRVRLERKYEKRRQERQNKALV